MIKTIGIFLLCSSISVSGVYYSEKIKIAAKILNEYIKLAEFIKNKIMYDSCALYKIYKSYNSQILYERGFINTAVNNEVYENKLRIMFPELDTQDILNITVFFNELGKSHHKESEVTLCDKYINLFSNSLKTYKEKLNMKAQLYKKISIIISIATAIILI